MSQKSLKARTLATAAGAAALSLFGAASAQAASQTLGYTCQYPLIGNQALSVAIDASIPTSVPAGAATGKFAITAKASASADTGSAIALIGATSLEGSATADAALSAPGFDLPVGVAIEIPSYAVPAGNKPALVLPATGSTPSIRFPSAGYGAVDVGALNLVLTARKADGTAITQLSKAQTVPATDEDPATFDVACTLNSGQNSRLANVAITDAGGQVPGQAPGAISVNPVQSLASTGTQVPYGYSMQGAATLKTLVQGALPLTGSADATLNLDGGAFSADLKFGRATGNLTAAGILPVQAKVDIVPIGAATGSLVGGVLNVNAKVRIKLQSVTLAGIPLGGGSGCQAKNISSINLKSTAKVFYPLDGGAIAGTFGISELVNCGFLTGIISPLTAGNGNAIALKLSSKL